MIQTKIMEKYFFFGLLLATLIFTFLIFRPFLVVLIVGACFSIVLYPLHKWFNKKLPNSLSALLTVLFFIIVICGPILGIGAIVFNQSQNLNQIITASGKIAPFVDSLNESISKTLPQGMHFDIYEKITSLISTISSNLASIFSATVSTVLSITLIILTIFYMLKDGEEWKKTILRLSPLSSEADEKIINRMSKTINGVIMGYLLVALAQGVLMGIGLKIFGVPNPALWGVVTAIVSMIPTIGTSLVSIPAVIYLFSMGNIPQAIGMMTWAIALVGTIDNLLSPFIVAGRVNLPPFLILFSILGGISMMGPAGILIGPLTVSLLYTLVSIYRSEFREQKND